MGDAEYGLAYDAGDDTTLYVYQDYSEPTNEAAARRRGGESCATVWERTAPYGQGVAAILGPATAHNADLWAARTANRQELRSRIVDMAQALDVTVAGQYFASSDCVADDPLVTAATGSRFAVAMGHPADIVTIKNGTVVRTLFLDTDELRQLAATDPNLTTLFPALEADLSLIDEITQYWIDSGNPDAVGRDRVELRLNVSEDFTGNALAMWGEYSVWLSQTDDPNIRQWADRFVYFRLPT